MSSWETTEEGGARPAAGSRFLLITGEGMLSTYEIEHRELVIGRAEGCDVQIDHPALSRRHAVLHGGPPTTVADLGSKNGTFLGKYRVVAGIHRIRLGKDQVQAHGARTLQPVEQRRVDRAPPGPAPQRLDARVVDRHHQDVRIGGALGHHDRAVIADLVEPAKSVE